MAGNTGSPGITVASRVLAILGAFDATHRALTLTQIAERAGLATATAHRLLGELVEWGALRRDAAGRYTVGQRLWNLGLLAPVQTGLRETASPFLHDLYGATLATGHIAVRDQTRVLYVDTVRGNSSVPIVSTVGSRLPLYCTGVGKVLLAHAPEEVRAAVLAAPMRPFTRHTITQPVRLERELARVVAEGYATTQEEMTLGACSVAVPVEVDGTVVASVAVVVGDVRRTRGRLVAALRVAAQGISRSLAARSPR